MKLMKNAIIRYTIIFPFLLVLLVLIDGLNILTINWQKTNAEIIEVKYVEHILNSKNKGTIPKIYSEAKIKYSLTGQEHERTILINYKVNVGQNIEIRFNKNGNSITASYLNYYLYLTLLTIIVIYFVVFIILVIIPRLYEKI